MSARPLPVADATALRLVALLEQYRQDIEDLKSTWLDAEHYARVSRGLEEMRVLCAGLPMLSVPWMQLMISNAELVNCLWTASASGEVAGVQRCKAEHLVAIHALRDTCHCYFTLVECSLE